MAEAKSIARSPQPVDVKAVLGKLSVLDRYLPLWIFLAMAGGVALGSYIPGFPEKVDSLKAGGISLPIAAGLLWMMYPALAKVKYEELGKLTRAWKLFGMSLALNWVAGPLLMFALAWLLLPDKPEYRTGVILVGLARCIAMVLVWNQQAGGDPEVAAILVAINSIFQVLAYAFYAFVFLTALPQWLGFGEGQAIDVGFSDVAMNVLVFLGTPLALGALTRYVGVRLKGKVWYEKVAMARLGPTGLLGLLFTILVMFSLKGDVVLALPGDVVRIALPLLAYFAIMFAASFWWGRRSRLPYKETTTLSFTASSNNFDLAIAVAVGTFGIGSGQALATVVGTLIEVPALVGLVYVALWLGRKLRWGG